MDRWRESSEMNSKTELKIKESGSWQKGWIAWSDSQERFVPESPPLGTKFLLFEALMLVSPVVPSTRSSGTSLSVSLEFGSRSHVIPRQPCSLRFLCELGVVAYAFHPSAWEAGAGRSWWIGGLPGLHSSSHGKATSTTQCDPVSRKSEKTKLFCIVRRKINTRSTNTDHGAYLWCF